MITNLIQDQPKIINSLCSLSDSIIDIMTMLVDLGNDGEYLPSSYDIAEITIR